MTRLLVIIAIVLGSFAVSAQDTYLQNRRKWFQPVAAAPGGVGTDPTNVAGLYAQWVADDIGLTDGAAVSNWTDRVSSWTVSMLTNSGRMPVYSNSIYNGHDTVVFTSDYLFTSNAVFTSYWQGQDMAYTMIAVARRATTNGSETIFSISTNNVWSMIYWDATAVFMTYDAGTGYSGKGTNDTSLHVWTFVDHGTTLSSWIDRYRDQTNKAADRGNNAPYSVCIGSYLLTTGGWTDLLDGNLCEVLVYTNAVSGANVTNIVDFLIDKYGITPF